MRWWWATTGILATLAACVGDNPDSEPSTTSSSGSSGAGADAGGDGSAVTPPSTDIELRVLPVETLRASTAVVRVEVVAREGAKLPLSLSLQGLADGLTSEETTRVLGTEETGTSFSVDVDANATLGDHPLAIVVDGPGLQAPISLPAPFFVRGNKGQLDTTFGEGGVAKAPASAQIADALMLPDGRLYAVGNLMPTAALYDADGKLIPDFGVDGFQDVVIPGNDRSGYRGQWGMNAIRANGDGSVSVALHAYVSTATVRLMRLDSSLSAPYTSSFVPDAQPTGSATLCNGESDWTLAYGIGFRTLNNGATNCDETRPDILAHDANSTALWSFGTQGSVEVADIYSPDSVRLVGTSLRMTATAISGARGLHSVNLDSAERASVDLQASTGTFDLSEPSAEGALLAILPTASDPCLTKITPGGTLDPTMAGACRTSATWDQRRSGGTFLAAGGYAVVAVGATSTVWTGANGTTDSGVAIDGLNGGTTTRVLHVFEASHGRVVVVTREPSNKPWNIVRVWL